MVPEAAVTRRKPLVIGFLWQLAFGQEANSQFRKMSRLVKKARRLHFSQTHLRHFISSPLSTHSTGEKVTLKENGQYSCQVSTELTMDHARRRIKNLRKVLLRLHISNTADVFLLGKKHPKKWATQILVSVKELLWVCQSLTSTYNDVLTHFIALNIAKICTA